MDSGRAMMDRMDPVLVCRVLIAKILTKTHGAEWRVDVLKKETRRNATISMTGQSKGYLCKLTHQLGLSRLVCLCHVGPPG